MQEIKKKMFIWITIIGLLLPATNGFLDLVIDRHEMQKLMGEWCFLDLPLNSIPNVWKSDNKLILFGI